MVPAHWMACRAMEMRTGAGQFNTCWVCHPMGEALDPQTSGPQTSKGREDVSSKGRELLERLFPYLYGQTYTSVSGQMIVYFYPNLKRGDMSPDANSFLSHFHTAALSIKEMLLFQFWDVSRD